MSEIGQGRSKLILLSVRGSSRWLKERERKEHEHLGFLATLLSIPYYLSVEINLGHSSIDINDCENDL